MLKGLALGLPTSQVGGGVVEVCTGIRACAPFSALLLPRVRRGDVGCLLLPRLPPPASRRPCLWFQIFCQCCPT